MIYTYAMVAALSVAASETVFVQTPSWWARAWLFIPLAIVTNVAIYRLVHATPTLLDAFVVFSFATMALRIGSSVLILQQPVSVGTWAAVGLIALAKVVQGVWG